MEKEYIFGIDVDCVLRDILPKMVKLYNDEFGTSMQVEDIYEFKVEKPFYLIKEKLGIEASVWFFEQHAEDIFKNSKVCNKAKEAVDILSKYGKIIIITYQKSILNKKYTLEWLEENEIKYDGISFIKDKSIINCDYFIDDNDWNFTNCNATMGILITQPYNKNINVNELKEKTNCELIHRCADLFNFASEFEAAYNMKEKINYN